MLKLNISKVGIDIYFWSKIVNISYLSHLTIVSDAQKNPNQ